MSKMNVFGSMLALTGALLLGGGCASTEPQPYLPQGGIAGPDNVHYRYGVIQSVELVKQGGIGIGTIAGAVVGGVIGNQVGAGRGNTVATVIGAAGGAYVGHEIDNRRQQDDGHRITVRMDGGTSQVLMENADTGSYRIGDRVRIDNSGVMQRY